MSEPRGPQPDHQVIDIRTLSEQQTARHVLDVYVPLNTGASLVVLAEQEPAGLRDELERELDGAFQWDTLTSDDDHFRARITKLADTALPRIVANTNELLNTASPDSVGSIWRLEPGARDLDSNIVALPPEGQIAEHIGPDLDVLILGLAGSGELHTELSVIPLDRGALVWLPAKSQRRFSAGPDGLRYLTVHHRKPTLNITTAPER